MALTKKYRLVVSIPTYNRAQLLDDLLWNIGPQIERSFPECACYIIDNASPDETGDIVRAHMGRWKGLHYIRNDANIGGVRNIAKAITDPDAEWIWLLGDDDIPMPWGIQDLLKEITEVESRCNEPVFHLMNEIKLTADKQPPYRTHRAIRGADRDSVTVYQNGVEIAEHGVHGLAWLSRLVVRQSSWKQDIFDSVLRETDLYTHVRVLLESACHGQTTYTKRCYVYGTDRGSREYYFSRTAIARVCEFPEIEKLVVEAIGLRRARSVLRPGRKNWTLERAAFAIKIGVFRDQYSTQLKYILAPISPFWEERILIQGIYRVTQYKAVRSLLQKLYFRSRGADAQKKLDVNG
ncbi:glycosyltransferase family 2 protein [Hydrocarboniphaga sp.]|uniref:glycosyltransferase family 2 protein n=1 Tax=Hydrocarboniphaga sp. TaxID=2033016 RepID=UPI003D103AFF